MHGGDRGPSGSSHRADKGQRERPQHGWLLTTAGNGERCPGDQARSRSALHVLLRSGGLVLKAVGRRLQAGEGGDEVGLLEKSLWQPVRSRGWRWGETGIWRLFRRCHLAVRG